MRIVEAKATSMVAAILRAAHQVLDDDPKILEDPIAVGFVEGSSEEEIRRDEGLLQEANFRFARCLINYRSRYVEDRLRECVAEAVHQYILLGAGFDTFGYRQPPWARRLRIVEVDHPAAQKTKLLRLRSRGIEAPANIHFCGVDFEHGSLGSVLAAAGVDPGAPAFFSWMGVSAYLSRSAVESMFHYVATLPRGSRIVFTVNVPRESLDTKELAFHDFGKQVAVQREEPIKTLLDPVELRLWLLAQGFSEVDHLTPAAANVLYCAGRRDGLRVPEMQQVMVAAV